MIRFVSGQVMRYYVSHNGRPVCMYRVFEDRRANINIAPENNVARIVDILNYGLNNFFEMGDMTGMQLPYKEDENKPQQLYVLAPWP